MKNLRIISGKLALNDQDLLKNRVILSEAWKTIVANELIRTPISDRAILRFKPENPVGDNKKYLFSMKN